MELSLKAYLKEADEGGHQVSISNGIASIINKKVADTSPGTSNQASWDIKSVLTLAFSKMVNYSIFFFFSAAENPI